MSELLMEQQTATNAMPNDGGQNTPVEGLTVSNDGLEEVSEPPEQQPEGSLVSPTESEKEEKTSRAQNTAVNDETTSNVDVETGAASTTATEVHAESSEKLPHEQVQDDVEMNHEEDSSDSQSKSLSFQQQQELQVGHSSASHVESAIELKNAETSNGKAILPPAEHLVDDGISHMSDESKLSAKRTASDLGAESSLVDMSQQPDTESSSNDQISSASGGASDDIVVASGTDDIEVTTSAATGAAQIPRAQPAATEVIDLLDSDSEDDTPAAKRPRTMPPAAPIPTQLQNLKQPPRPLVNGVTSAAMMPRPPPPTEGKAVYMEPTPGFTPTWKTLMPPGPTAPRMWRAFRLSLLNVSEFTVTGTWVGDDVNGYMTTTDGLRTHIKQVSKGHGNAVYERDADGGGKWRIPLGAYYAFYGYLTSDPMCRVEGIPEAQLKIASLGKARLEKDYPSAKKLKAMGVPPQLAMALAPFQRGGVDFVIEKQGRALIADEMGLGKSIQAVASMSVYHGEWPLLVLCPSSARYHWQNEFRQWLGQNSAINKSKRSEEFDQESEKEEDSEEEEIKLEPRTPMTLLEEEEIHVLTSAKDTILMNTTKVVICSYGLVPNLIANGRITPGMFQCAIVDESHMLKNKATKRTKSLLPVLCATKRCLLLSGTPAFARPMELLPQLTILGTEQYGGWRDESEFIRQYARGSRHAELHTMLTGTVMIRRMKNDILKSLPAKVREQGIVDVMDDKTREEMQQCMEALRSGKGKLCELAREHSSVKDSEPELATASLPQNNAPSEAAAAQAQADQLAAATAQLHLDIDARRAQGHESIRHALATTPYQLDQATTHAFVSQMQDRLENEIQVYYNEQMNRINQGLSAVAIAPAEQEERPKRAILNHMYNLTGNAKIPIVVSMLKRWLKDPTRGKLCVFAHHISVLDAIVQGAGLSNAPNSTTKYIRIDGSTLPQARQDQINAFQGDPSIRIAILGITAAGVAVTLTASSTVWFTELFWTPAIMIQAEDRVHRIGQQAQVQCLYFVAKGTLDELLWKLLETKFEALGEFVEGKEKQKMVVSKKYHSARELLKTIEAPDLSDSDAFGNMSDADSDRSLSPIQELDTELVHEIEELGLSEQTMLNNNASPDDDDSDPDTAADPDSKPAAKETKEDVVMGRSENEAICLSDDDEEEEDNAPPAASQGEANSSPKQPFEVTTPLPNLRLYKILFACPKYGLEFRMHVGRLVVSGRSDFRVQMLGPEAKPHVGDALAAVNGQVVPIVADMAPLVKVLSQAIKRGPVELIFAEDADIAAQVEEAEVQRSTALQAAHAQSNRRTPSESETNRVSGESENGQKLGATQSGTVQHGGADETQMQKQPSDDVIILIDD